MSPPPDAQAWLDAYAAAWRAKAPEHAARLFSPDASYTSDPFGPGLRGREEIAAYWAEATGGQGQLSLRVGPPSIGPDRVAAEWWASFRRGGEEVTLAACVLLRFDADGLCCELREYWRQATAIQEPPPGWLT